MESKEITNLIKDREYKNEIELFFNISDTDLDEEISFLNNTNRFDYLFMLNEENTKLLINDKEEIFKKFFIPTKQGIYKIKLIINFQMTNCKYMFAGCSNIIKIDLSSFNTQKIEDMSFMFLDCYDLTEIDLSSFNTRNVTNMNHMFSGCINLTEIDVSSFDTRKVKDTSYMFSKCSSLKNIDLSSFYTPNLKFINNMFAHCKNLENINLSNFNTKNVTNMELMFFQCGKLTNIDVSFWNVENVMTMQKMFSWTGINKIDLSSFNIKNTCDVKYFLDMSSDLTEIKVNRKSYLKIKNEDCGSKQIIIIEI